MNRRSALLLGTQYYRPPFPNTRFWRDDLARMRDVGLNTVQFWIVWAWVEPSPGDFRFDDYDQLMELAEGVGLGVVLSTIAAVQPLWIHDQVPHCHLIDHRGRTCYPQPRGECHFGLTPGGCTDHPEVWRHMARFLETTGQRYAGRDVLRGYDIWNELRWNVDAGGLTCFCEHTLKAFRDWLAEQFGDLGGLNRAWQRRYTDWSQVMPGRTHGRPYTELMAFQYFLTVRHQRHARDRYQIIKPHAGDRPVVLHGAWPAPWWVGSNEDHALNRGNDWLYSADVDGIGTSAFPLAHGIDEADLTLRLESVRSSAAMHGKRAWLSELTGGRLGMGFLRYEPVAADVQQTWIWRAIAGGCETVLFWCWRDEVFGPEAGGYGFIGRDGFAPQRIEAMKRTTQVAADHEAALDAYRPLAAEVGLLFSPQNYFLHWAQSAQAQRMIDALTGYGRALVRQNVPLRLVEEDHLNALDGLKLLILPRTLVTDDALATKLTEFVCAGGTIVCESECGAFDRTGIHRYPPDRFLAGLAGIVELGRRDVDAEPITIECGSGDPMRVPAHQWLTPLDASALPDHASVMARHDDGPLAVSVPVGSGRVVYVGTYPGQAYRAEPAADFERLVARLVEDSGALRPARVLESKPRLQPMDNHFVGVQVGRSGGRSLAFVFHPPSVTAATIAFAPGTFGDETVHEWITGRSLPVRATDEGQVIDVPAGPWRVSVLSDA